MVLDDIASYLETAGIGTVGTDLFKSGIPLDTPNLVVQDSLVALIEIPGLPPVHAHGSMQASFLQPVIQIVVRGTPYDYVAARDKAEQVFLALDGLANQQIGEHFYLWVQALRSPYRLRVDDLNRPHVVFDIRCALGPGTLS